MKTKFTAGPWEQDKYLNVVDGKGERVLFRGVSSLMSGERSAIEEAEANTTLIASVHDLLEALRLMVDDHFPDLPLGEQARRLTLADDAIAKATGE